MPDLVIVERRQNVLVILINNPPVNALSPGVPEGIEAAIEVANTDEAVRAVVIGGAGRTFIAGADITTLDLAAWGDLSAAPDMHDMLARIESCRVPVVMAIHGTALGGGNELAMAGHYRVALASAQIGQPEVNLGIIPGAEGTQRLPRLVGVEKALDLCVSGRPLRAAEALAAGLLDAIVEGDLIDEAMSFATAVANRGGPHRRTSERTDRLGGAAANAPLFEAARALAAKIRPRQTAPLRAVDAVEAATTLPFQDGCRRERAIFFECVQGEQAKALIHLFFAERAAAKVRGVGKEVAPLPVARVGIIGAGTMGGGIAMACVNAGLEVRLKDTTQAAIDQGVATIRRNYGFSVSRGRMTQEAADARVASIRTQVDYAGFDEVDLVVEAAFENLELKRQIFTDLGAVVKADCVLGTNTSTLDIDVIAAASSRAPMVVGLHFFSPANVMRLLEIVRGKETSPAVLATAQAFGKKLGKVGVVVGNCPGFVGNRMMFPYMYETQFMVEEGATPEQVDRALTRFGMAMGMFAVDDMAGLDIAWRVRQELGHFREPGVRKPLVADRLVEMGRLGQKSGKGWYVYDDKRKPAADPEVIDLIRSLASEARVPQHSFTEDEIVERAIYALVNEGARVLDEGFAERASDIDVIYASGYGFPGWRGGPLFHADRVGLERVLSRVSAFHNEFGERWRPAPLLQRLVAEGRTFRDRDRSGRG